MFFCTCFKCILKGFLYVTLAVVCELFAMLRGVNVRMGFSDHLCNSSPHVMIDEQTKNKCEMFLSNDAYQISGQLYNNFTLHKYIQFLEPC